MAIVTINQLSDSSILSGNEVIPIFQDGCTVKTPVSSFQTSFGNNNNVTGVYSNIDGGKDNIVSGNFTSIQSGSANCVTGDLNIITGRNNTSHGNSNTFINTEFVSANDSSSFNTLIGVESPSLNSTFNKCSIIFNNSKNNSVMNTLNCTDFLATLFFDNANHNNIIGGVGLAFEDTTIRNSNNNFISIRCGPVACFENLDDNVLFLKGHPTGSPVISSVTDNFILGGTSDCEMIVGCSTSFVNIIEECATSPFTRGESRFNIIQLMGDAGGTCNRHINVRENLFLNNSKGKGPSSSIKNLVYGLSNSSIIGTSNLRAGTTYNDVITADSSAAIYKTPRSYQTLILGGSGLNVTHGHPGGVLIGGMQNSLLSAMPNTPTDDSRFSISYCRLNNAIIGGEKNIIKGCNVCNSTIIASFSSRIDRDISPNVQNNSVIIGGNETTAVSSNMLHAERLYLGDLPTSNPGVPGVVWNNSGILQISV